MTETKIDYESLAQDALRGVVRAVLARVAQHEQLPGNHHFYISFNTNSDGVGISKRLREQYPDEMTIVLQHRYWDLQVHDDRFEVKLTFNSIPERLVVPYTALKVFFDPSVPYGLQFESAGPITADTLPLEPASPRDLPQLRLPGKRPRPVAVKDQARDTSRDPSKPRAADRQTNTPVAMPAVKPKPVAAKPSDISTTPAAIAPPEAEPEQRPAGQVVQLDTFRKK